MSSTGKAPVGAGVGTGASSILVVGAGVFGVTAALELASRGHDVTLADPGPLPHPDAASTDVSKMVRLDYGSDELYTELMEIALPRWEAWNRAWGESLYHPDGFLLAAEGGLVPGSFEQQSWETLRARGHSLERFDADELSRRFPAWAPGKYAGAYYNPQGGWAESGRVMARLVDSAERAGVRLLQGFAMTGCLEEGGRVVGAAASDGRQVRASTVVIAAGAWTPELVPHLGEDLWAVGQPVFRFLPDRPGDFRPPAFRPWAADISRTGWYGFPALEDGTVKVANHGPGRRMRASEPRVVGEGEEARFRAFLRGTFPGLAEAPVVATRLCLYCDTRDGDFWIDHDREGLVVAAGGSGHAFKFAPVLGEIVADVVMGKANRYASRFARRGPLGRNGEAARRREP